MPLPVGNQRRGDMPGPMTGSYVYLTASFAADLGTDGLTEWRWYIANDMVIERVAVGGIGLCTAQIEVEVAWTPTLSDNTGKTSSFDNILVSAGDYDGADDPITGDGVLTLGPSGTGADISFDGAVSRLVTAESILGVELDSDVSGTLAGPWCTVVCYITGHAHTDPQYDR